MYRHANRHPAFTLIEVMVATMIIALLGVSLHRFVATQVRSIRYSTEIHNDGAALDAVIAVVRRQLGELGGRESDQLKGKANRFRGLSNDELTWRCSAGSGLMTTAAKGRFQVTLTVQPVSETSAETELGLRREPLDEKGQSAAFLNRGGGDHRYSWLSLIRPMAAVEVRYFDLANHAWVDAWTEPSRLPELVKIKLWRRVGDPPVEAVLPVPAARIQP